MEHKPPADTQVPPVPPVPPVPEDIRALAARLDRLGAQERKAGEDASCRVAMRTTNLLHAEPAATAGTSVSGSARRAWLWFAAPTIAAAVVLLAVVMVMPRPGSMPDEDGTTNGVDILAAGIESDIDAYLAMDAYWDEDAFETGLAAISLDAAGLANQPTDTTETLTTLGDEL